MVAEISLNAGGTFLAVMIMYLHSKAAFGVPVPGWLLKLLWIGGNCKKREKRPIANASYTNGSATMTLAEKTIIANVYTTVSSLRILGSSLFYTHPLSYVFTLKFCSSPLTATGNAVCPALAG